MKKHLFLLCFIWLAKREDDFINHNVFEADRKFLGTKHFLTEAVIFYLENVA